VNRLFRAAYPVVTLTAPSVCFAIGDGADAAAILDVLIKFVAFEVAWTLFVLTVFLLLRWRKMSSKRRLVYCVVLWFSQLLGPFVIDFGQMLYGHPGEIDTEVTKKPVVLAGVTFPVGSTVQYTHTGGGFWRRELTGAKSTQPVKLGSLAITGLVLHWPPPSLATIDLAHAEIIDGWPCSGTVNLDSESEPPSLFSCHLASARAMGDVVWPAGTYVDIALDVGWSLSWSRDDDGDRRNPPAQAFGFAIERMSATYNESYELQKWEAKADNHDLPVRGYTFSGPYGVDLKLRPSGEIVVEGFGTDDKTNASVSCVRVQLRDRSARPCWKSS
jgi:hypothetical protein